MLVESVTYYHNMKYQRNVERKKKIKVVTIMKFSLHSVN